MKCITLIVLVLRCWNARPHDQPPGWTEGNNRALQIVTDADEADVASPYHHPARDSIIAADAAGLPVKTFRHPKRFSLRAVWEPARMQPDQPSSPLTSLFSQAACLARPQSPMRDGNNNGVFDPGETLW